VSTYNGESTTTDFVPHPLDGTLAYDSSTGQTGLISGQEIERISWSDELVRRRVWLAPVGGGYHWPANPDALTKPV